LASQAFGINRARIQQAATKANSGVSVKRGCLACNLCVARAKTAKSCASSPTTNENVAVSIYINSPVYGRVRKSDRALPRDAAVCGALQCRVGASAISGVVYLVLEAVPRAVCFVYRQPLFVAARASVGRLLGPCLPAVGRAPQVVTVKRLVWPGGLQTEIKKLPGLIGVCYGIAAEDVILQDTWKCPCNAGIGCITPAALPEVGSNVIKLPPGNGHFVAVGRVNRDRALVGCVTYDVVAIRIDVHLVADEAGIRRDHSPRGLHFSRRRRRVVGCFQVPIQRRHPHRRNLSYRSRQAN